jgi:hypothetical protein
MAPGEPETKNDCAGEGQQKFTRQNINFSRMALLLGFEVLTAVVMKSSIFWDITPYVPFKINRHFGGTCSFHRQGRRISQARNQHEEDSKQSSLHGVISQ